MRMGFKFLFLFFCSKVDRLTRSQIIIFPNVNFLFLSVLRQVFIGVAVWRLAARVSCLASGDRWAGGRAAPCRLPISYLASKLEVQPLPSATGLVHCSLAIPRSDFGALFLPCSEKPLVVLRLLKWIHR